PVRSTEALPILLEVRQPGQLPDVTGAAPETLGDLGIRLALGPEGENPLLTWAQAAILVPAASAGTARMDCQLGDQIHPLGRLAEPATDLFVAQALLTHGQDPGLDRTKVGGHWASPLWISP